MSTTAVTPDDPTQNYPASPDQGGPVPSVQSQPDAAPSQPAAAPPQPQSRLGAIIGAVAKVASAGLQGIPDTGRPGFVSGLGQGARAIQGLKFKSFDDQVRLAQLHNQDIKMQNDTQAQKDAHISAELQHRALANSLGIDYDTIANDGQTVMDHLTAQSAGGGAASVPPGTHIAGDGKTINIPKDTQATRDGQKQMYSMLGPAFGLPSLPASAQFVPPQQLNMLTNKMNGYGIDGKPVNHQDLPGVIGALTAQRDRLKESGASPDVIKTLDGTLKIYQANLDGLDKHAAGVKAQGEQAKLDVQNAPQNVAAAGNKAAKIEQAKLNVTNAPANQAAAARGAAQKTAAEQSAKSTGELNAVAFDPSYQNADGTKGANVVMNKEEAQAKGLSHYKADAGKLNTVVAGMNDVQNKLNQLADVATNPQRMDQVQPALAAAMLTHGKGINLEHGGVGIDTSRINEKLYAEDVKSANQATRDYVTAMVAAHEAVTQLPRLQTFGQSNRMTEKQMEAAINLLPHPGDGSMAGQKMTSLQGMLDPLRKQIPHMPGAESLPSWMEKKQQQQPQQPAAPQSVGRFNPQTKTIDFAIPSVMKHE